MPKPVPTVLVCMPADAPTMVPGSAFDRACEDCGRQVMIAPSGQKRLAREALRRHALRVICWPCFQEAQKKGKAASLGYAGDDWNEVRREVQSGVPNFWRRRN